MILLNSDNEYWPVTYRSNISFTIAAFSGCKASYIIGASLAVDGGMLAG